MDFPAAECDNLWSTTVGRQTFSWAICRISAFDGPFEELKHRVLAIGSACGVSWGSCAALGVLLAAVGVDLVWELSAAARIVALCCGLAAGIVLLMTFARAAYRKTRDVLMARRLDETGATGGEIVAAYELQSYRQVTVPAAGLTRGLAELAVSAAAAHRRARPAQRTRRTGLPIPCLSRRRPDRGHFCAAARLGIAQVYSIRSATIRTVFPNHGAWRSSQGTRQIRYGDPDSK